MPASPETRRKRRRPVLPRDRKPRTPWEYFALMGTTSKYAIAGITHTFRHQRNLRNHAAGCAAVAVVGLIVGLTPSEWAILFLAMGLLLSAELMNTAVEAVVDLVTAEWHDLARIAKDAAAGAVFIAMVAAIAAAVFVLFPKLF